MDTQLHSSDDGYERTTKVVLDGEILRIFLIAAIKVRLNDRDLVVEMSEKLVDLASRLLCRSPGRLTASSVLPTGT